MSKEFFRFLLTGGCSTSVQYALFGVGISALYMDVTLASAVSYLGGALVSYIMSYYYTFDSKRAHGKTVVLFGLMVATGLSVNTASVHMLTTGLALSPWSSQIIATVLTLLWNFFISKVFVFGWKR